MRCPLTRATTFLCSLFTGQLPAYRSVQILTLHALRFENHFGPIYTVISTTDTARLRKFQNAAASSVRQASELEPCLRRECAYLRRRLTSRSNRLGATQIIDHGSSLWPRATSHRHQLDCLNVGELRGRCHKRGNYLNRRNRPPRRHLYEVHRMERQILRPYPLGLGAE